MDWTDLESFSRPPPARGGDCADPEASWGHRKNNLLRSQDELFFGYYFSAGDHDARGERPGRPRVRPPLDPVVLPARPGPRARARADRDARRRDPARRRPRRLRLRPPRRRRLGDAAARRRRPARPGPAPPRPRPQGHPRRRHHQPTATCTARARPAPCWNSGRSPAAPPAKTSRRARRQDRRTGPLQARPHHPRRRRRLPPRRSAPPPWARSAARSARLDDPGPGPARDPQPPEHPQACCTQQTITVPPEVIAKTAQKHDYPSAAHRRSYARRTGAERGFATAKDPATNDISRGWCRLMGLAPLMLFTTTLLVVRNQRILAAWNARQEENQRRAAAGLPPKTRKRRRKTLAASPPGRPDHRSRERQPPNPPSPPTTTAAACPETRQHCTESHHTNRNARNTLVPATRPSRAQNVRPKRENRPH